MLGQVIQTLHKEVRWVSLEFFKALKCSAYQDAVSAGLNLAFFFFLNVGASVTGSFSIAQAWAVQDQ